MRACRFVVAEHRSLSWSVSIFGRGEGYMAVCAMHFSVVALLASQKISLPRVWLVCRVFVGSAFCGYTVGLFKFLSVEESVSVLKCFSKLFGNDRSRSC